jgi:hypothetical protein
MEAGMSHSQGEPGNGKAGRAAAAALAWQLASRKGEVDIDRAALGHGIWIPCLPVFPEGYNRDSWAADTAKTWWKKSGLRHRKKDVRLLTRALVAIHMDVYAAGHCHMAFIHEPDPRMLPLPVQLGIWAMAGEKDDALLQLVNAGDPDAVEIVVQEFTTDHLGTGLRSQRQRRGRREGEVDGYLDYAWRSEQCETDLRLFTFSWGLQRLELALPDIDALARAIRVVPVT